MSIAVALLDSSVLLVRPCAVNAPLLYEQVSTWTSSDIADFLGIEASILYSQGFSTIPCVISAFAKRGDIIVADRGINFAIQNLKGLQIFRSTVRSGWSERSHILSDRAQLTSLPSFYALGESVTMNCLVIRCPRRFATFFFDAQEDVFETFELIILALAGTHSSA